jgi:hypothetical protein
MKRTAKLLKTTSKITFYVCLVKLCGPIIWKSILITKLVSKHYFLKKESKIYTVDFEEYMKKGSDKSENFRIYIFPNPIQSSSRKIQNKENRVEKIY